jgi:hypothetical protein
MTGLGNETQSRLIADQVAEAAILRFYQTHTEARPKPEMQIPPPLKWAAGIISAVFAAAAVAMALWMVTTLSDLQQTVVRIDERQKAADPSANKRFDDIERRIGVLEGYHRSADR